MMRRRDLLQTVAVAWFADQVLPDHEHIRGQLVGASHRVGHKLRMPLPAGAPDATERTQIVVVGGGVSGLTAAWRLEGAGAEVMGLELEPFIGGTSTWGQQGVVPHPWGAHYLPVPEPEAEPVRRILAELGVLTGWDAAGRPLFAGEHLCHAPEERLFYRGQWYGGLIPWDALTLSERREMERFQTVVESWATARGSDGKRAFTIPLTGASRDPRFVALDRISMADWLDERGFSTPFLRWYVEYGTRDDFGAVLSETSAWAGLHYFAARSMETAQLEGSRYLVWPEGNGWLVKGLRSRLSADWRHRALALRVAPSGAGGVAVDYLDVERDEVRRVTADGVVLATPSFVTSRLVAGLTGVASLPARATSPWVVANVHVERDWEPNRAWDSMIYDSPSLGYVDAGHQGGAPKRRTVLTHFTAFGDADVAGTRAMLLGRGWAGHAGAVLADLRIAHPEIVEQCSRVDVMVWGHAMPRPRPGFLGRDPMGSSPMIAERVAWGHVDQTGYALFEEATDRGVRAAEALGEALGLPMGDSYV
ncbi:MAG: FAD-dependent oxidoreductase [Polyangiaceae bacterium]